MAEVKVSILTPTLDRPEFLARCIASVLRQTHTDWEQIVYNVGSPAEVPDDPRILYHVGERRGPAADFQSALDLATGDIIHPLADDDRLPAHALETALAALGTADWLNAKTVIVNRDGYPLHLRGGRIEHLEETRRGGYMLGGSVYWRKNLSDELGGFNPDFDGAADFDLYQRFLAHSEPRLIPDILYLYTDHEQTDSRRFAARQAEASGRIRAAA